MLRGDNFGEGVENRRECVSTDRIIQGSCPRAHCKL